MKIVYIEGADCIGKTTLIRRLKDKLEKEGYRVFATREPDYFIREELLQEGKKEYNYYVRRLLMSVSHIQKVQDIKDLKASGEYDIILVDRTSVISDYVYGYKLQLDQDYFFVNRRVNDIIKEVNSEIKNDSYLVIGNIDDNEFDKRASSRKEGSDIYDEYDTKKRVKEKYNETIDEIKKDTNLITSMLLGDHFKDIFIVDFSDTIEASQKIFDNVIKEEQ